LRERLTASAPARIVNTASGAHQGARLDFDDLQSQRRYSGFAVYSKSKLANILFSRELARRLAGTGVTAHCLPPGRVATPVGALAARSAFLYTLSIPEPLTDLTRLREVHQAHGLWSEDAGALAIVEHGNGRLLGTTQFYRSSPVVHGYEIGYILHDEADRGRG